MKEIKIGFMFRWPVVQTDEQSVEVVIPLDGASEILNKEFCRELRLSDVEIDEAQTAVLRVVALIKG